MSRLVAAPATYARELRGACFLYGGVNMFAVDLDFFSNDSFVRLTELILIDFKFYENNCSYIIWPVLYRSINKNFSREVWMDAAWCRGGIIHSEL